MSYEILKPANVPAMIETTIRVDNADYRNIWCLENLGADMSKDMVNGRWFSSGSFFFFVSKIDAKRFILESNPIVDETIGQFDAKAQFNMLACYF